MRTILTRPSGFSEQPIDVLVYRLRLPSFLKALEPTLIDAAQKVGDDPQTVFASLENTAPYASAFVAKPAKPGTQRQFCQS